jgi:hypothetical protein
MASHRRRTLGAIAHNRLPSNEDVKKGRRFSLAPSKYAPHSVCCFPMCAVSLTNLFLFFQEQEDQVQHGRQPKKGSTVHWFQTGEAFDRGT